MKAKLVRAFGGLVLVVVSFYATLFILDYIMPSRRNAARVEHIRELKTALEAYHRTFGEYPGPMDAPVANLKTSLAKYIADIPQDPWQSEEYRYHYTSDAKTYYGIHLRLEPIPFPYYGSKESYGCVTGAGLENTKAFGAEPPRRCPF